jgi:hypothetical protein
MRLTQGKCAVVVVVVVVVVVYAPPWFGQGSVATGK